MTDKDFDRWFKSLTDKVYNNIDDWGRFTRDTNRGKPYFEQAWQASKQFYTKQYEDRINQLEESLEHYVLVEAKQEQLQAKLAELKAEVKRGHIALFNASFACGELANNQIKGRCKDCAVPSKGGCAKCVSIDGYCSEFESKEVK